MSWLPSKWVSYQVKWVSYQVKWVSYQVKWVSYQVNELATKWNLFNIIGKQILKLGILFVQAYKKKYFII